MSVQGGGRAVGGNWRQRQAKPGGAAFHLNEPEVYALLGRAGAAPRRFCVCWRQTVTWPPGRQGHARLADGEGRLVLKLVGRDILHKTEAGGVRILQAGIGQRGRTSWRQQARDLLAGAQSRGVAWRAKALLAAAFVPHAANRPGQEALLTLRQDPAFGPVRCRRVSGAP